MGYKSSVKLFNPAYLIQNVLQKCVLNKVSSKCMLEIWVEDE
jgi:hypothetical protein